MTIAVATGYSIARSEKARAAWESARAERGAEARPPQTPEAYSSTLSRIGALLPGVVRVH